MYKSKWVVTICIRPSNNYSVQKICINQTDFHVVMDIADAKHPRIIPIKNSLCRVFEWFSAGRFYPYTSGLLHWHGDNRKIVPVPVKQPWWIWAYGSYRSIMNIAITKKKQGERVFFSWDILYILTHRQPGQHSVFVWPVTHPHRSANSGPRDPSPTILQNIECYSCEKPTPH